MVVGYPAPREVTIGLKPSVPLRAQPRDVSLRSSSPTIRYSPRLSPRSSPVILSEIVRAIIILLMTWKPLCR